jgi:heme exporter protein CcmD
LTHAGYIALAYGIAAAGFAGLIAWVWSDLRRQSRLLAELEAKGTARRRAAVPALPPCEDT